ncbi:hypothetical protein AYO22_01462 [Fonsecaea multimorphosa]|nr:hypothetical protein AYO22_01462 [Fonsecaea multimorphosa]
MSFWATLSVHERQQCFSKNPQPDKVLKAKLARKIEVWEVSGLLKQEWNTKLSATIAQVLSEKYISNEFFTKGHKRRSTGLPIWEIYVVLKKGRRESAQPTIFALHRDISVAKRAYRLIQDLKQTSLKALLQDFDIAYAEYPLNLRADAEGSSTPSTKQLRNLCGTHVVISRQTGEPAAQAWTRSTIGGVLRVNGTYFGLTTAHSFLEDEEDLTEQNRHDGSPSPLIRKPTWKVYAQNCAHDSTTADDTNCISAQPVDSANLINTTDANELTNVPVQNSQFTTTNSLSVGSGEEIQINLLADDIPSGQVMVASSVAQRVWADFPEIASVVALPDSPSVHIAWRVSQQTSHGDSGSWVIDRAGRAFGMIVAGSDEHAESYCLPLKSIFTDIQSHLGVSEMPSISEGLQINVQASGERKQQGDVEANGSDDVDRTEDRSMHAHVGDDELMTELFEPTRTTSKPTADEPRTTSVSASLSPESVLAEEDREEEGALAPAQTPAGQEREVITKPAVAGSVPEAHLEQSTTKPKPETQTLADPERSAVEIGDVHVDFRRGAPDRPGLVSGSEVNAVENLEAEKTEPGEFVPFKYPDELVEEDDDGERDVKSSYRHTRHSSAHKRVSRKDILTDSLDHYNIPWEWDPEDDYYVFVKEYLTKGRWHELRQHTAKIFEQRLEKQKQKQKSSLKANSTQSINHTPSYVQWAPESHQRTNQMVVRGAPPRRVDRTTNPSQLTQGDNSRQPRIAPEIASACRQLDLEFEGLVQDLVWDADCSTEFGQRVLAAHISKERSILEFAERPISQGTSNSPRVGREEPDVVPVPLEPSPDAPEKQREQTRFVSREREGMAMASV